MVNYSEDPNRQYHIQVAPVKLESMLFFREIQNAVRRLQNIWMMQNWLQTAGSL